MEEFDIENPLSLHLNIDQISSLFSLESDHMPSHNYSQILKPNPHEIRHESISLISHFSSNFTPYLSYLAVTYLDRFLSVQHIPERKPWISRILAISCFSLALKMTKAEASAINTQKDEQGGVIFFNPETIHRMELLILGVLKWRMRSITPFSFVNFLISFFNPKEAPFTQALKARANDIILKAQTTDTNSLKFKPSTMAASALLSSTHELFPLQFSSFKNAIFNCSYLNQEEIYRCYDRVRAIAMEEYKCSMERYITPVKVLDQQWWSLSNSSDEIFTEVVGEDDGYETVNMKRLKTGGGKS